MKNPLRNKGVFRSAKQSPPETPKPAAAGELTVEYKSYRGTTLRRDKPFYPQNPVFTHQDLQNVMKRVRNLFPEMDPFMYVVPFKVIDSAHWPHEDQNKLSEKLGMNLRTAGCGNKYMVFNAEFMASLDMPNRMGVLIHEIMHGALGHITHAYRDYSLSEASFRLLANIAQDIVINADLYEMADKQKVVDLPIPQHEDTLRFKGMGWREVYDILRSEAIVISAGGINGTKPGDGGMSGKFDAHEFEGEGGAETIEKRRQWQQATEESQAIAQAAKAAGDESDRVLLKFEGGVSVVPWQQQLEEWFTPKLDRNVRTWRAYSRRALMLWDEHFPGFGRSNQALSNISVFLDTSGSMQGDLQDAMAEINDLFRKCQIDRALFVEYDVGVQRARVLSSDFGSAANAVQDVAGLGGTSLQRALEQLNDPEALRDMADAGVCDSEVDVSDYFEEGVTIIITDAEDTYTDILRHLNKRSILWVLARNAEEVTLPGTVISMKSGR